MKKFLTPFFLILAIAALLLGQKLFLKAGTTSKELPLKEFYRLVKIEDYSIFMCEKDGVDKQYCFSTPDFNKLLFLEHVGDRYLISSYYIDKDTKLRLIAYHGDIEITKLKEGEVLLDVDKEGKASVFIDDKKVQTYSLRMKDIRLPEPL
jgi:hypothetical protein